MTKASRKTIYISPDGTVSASAHCEAVCLSLQVSQLSTSAASTLQVFSFKVDAPVVASFVASFPCQRSL